MARRKSRKIKVSDTFTFIIAVIILIIAIVWYYQNKEERQNAYTGLSEVFTGESTANTDLLKIHFIDIGQGDCMFIEFPDGKNMLIDAGNNGKGDEVVAYLKSINVKDITLILATHTDSDHIGGMEEVFEEYKVGYCLRPFVYYSGSDKAEFEDGFNMLPAPSQKDANYCNTKSYKYFLDCIINENCGWEFFNKNTDFTQNFTYMGETHTYSMDFLTPVAEVPNIAYSDSNDYSPITALTYGEFVIMFTGDAHENVEDELLGYYAKIPNVDVLKVGHHGSESSSSIEFLQRIAPEHAVIQCGNNETYKHPRQEVLTRLNSVDATIYRTDLQGNIVLTVQADGTYEFTTQRFASPEDLLIGKDVGE